MVKTRFNKLRDARIRDKKSQLELAVFLGVSKPFVSMMENGRKSFTDKALDYIDEVNLREKPTLGMDTPILEEKVNCNVKKTVVIERGKIDENGGSETFWDFPEFKTNKEFETWWWKEVNDVCNGCEKECKQSNKVRVVCCPSWTRRGQPPEVT